MDVQPGDIYTTQGSGFLWRELRPSVTSIQGYVRTLLEAPPGTFDDETIREFLEVVSVEAQRLAEQLEQLQAGFYQHRSRRTTIHPAHLSFELGLPGEAKTLLVLREPGASTHEQCTVAVIRTSEAEPQASMVPIPASDETGLPPSAWIDASAVFPLSPYLLGERVGRLTPSSLATVREGLRNALGLN